MDRLFNGLRKKGIKLSPFLEIGAERTQCSMVLKNYYNADGFAVDLSKDMLQFAGVILKPLGFKKMPIRVCCDAYNLPFRNNVFPFVFCYETLHHFPEPTPVILEIKRVMQKGGFFLLASEPIKRKLKMKLWTVGHRMDKIENC
ncbi:hypothetical protein ES703_38859 [subsurface metagenome]